MYNNNLTVELLTANGNKITEFSKDGRTYVEGRKGSNYKIKVTNHSHRRAKVIVSVDGLDIITGKRAIPGTGGYVLNAYASETFDGWRISDQQVREFFFTNEKNSYNAKTGNDTNNLGVIGVLAYYEQVSWSYSNSWRAFDTQKYTLTAQEPLQAFYGSAAMDSLPIAAMATTMNLSKGSGVLRSTAPQNASVGTGMGKVKESKVENVYATWETSTFSEVFIYYKSKKELESMGIIVAPVKQKPLPSAFAGYCKQV
jgi:hypothetical protein